MPNDVIAALERVARLCDDDASKLERWIAYDNPPPTWVDAYKAAKVEVETDAATIRALIADLQAGRLVRRVDVLPSSRAAVEEIAKRMGGRFVWNDAIAAGAHGGVDE